MRAVVQRVRAARICVADEELAAMGEGLLALIGVAKDDTSEDARELVQKLIHLRVFPDAQGRMNRSLLESGGTLGLVSQFTLLGDVRQGRRPSYAAAAPAESAEPLFASLVELARTAGVPVVTGRFRAEMDVSLVNTGPVTILVDTRRAF